MSALVPAAAAATAGIVRAGTGSAFPFVFVMIAASFLVTAFGFPCPDRIFRRAAGYGLFTLCGFIVGFGSAEAAQVASGSILPVPDEAVGFVVGTVVGAVVGAGNAVSGEPERPVLRVDLVEAGSRDVEGVAIGNAGVIVGRAVGGPDPRFSVGDTVRVGVKPGSAWRSDEGVLWLEAARAERWSPPSAGPAAGPLSRVVTLARTRGVATVGAARARVASAVDVVAGRAAPIVAALLLGDGTRVDPRVELLFRRSGTIHLLALSGMHLAVIAMLVGFAARRLVGLRAAGWVAVAFGLAYLLLAGPRPGLVRAWLLMTLATTMRTLDRPRPLVELLAACFLVQTLVQPAAVSSVAFQLSYLSLAGIALLAEPLAGVLQPWVPASVGSPLAAGVGAQLYTTPVLIARFGAWYPVGIVASLVMGPVVLLLMSVGLVAAAMELAGLPFVALIARPCLEVLGSLSERLAWVFSALPGIEPGPGAVAWVGGTTALAAVATVTLAWRGSANR